MKIELYLVPEDEEGLKIKEFLIRNNLPFKEVITEDISVLNKVRQLPPNWNSNRNSLLRIFYSSSIHVIDGYQEHALDQIIEHIKKYKSYVERPR